MSEYLAENEKNSYWKNTPFGAIDALGEEEFRWPRLMKFEGMSVRTGMNASSELCHVAGKE